MPLAKLNAHREASFVSESLFCFVIYRQKVFLLTRCGCLAFLHRLSWMPRVEKPVLDITVLLSLSHLKIRLIIILKTCTLKKKTSHSCFKLQASQKSCAISLTLCLIRPYCTDLKVLSIFSSNSWRDSEYRRISQNVKLYL